MCIWIIEIFTNVFEVIAKWDSFWLDDLFSNILKGNVQ